MSTDLSKSEREALKAIYRSTRDGSEAHTGSLAESLGLSPGTVTTLVKRLADRQLVVHRPYQGITFTDDGRRRAVGAIRRHRIVERFLSDMLGYAWNEADAYAASFEHEMPAEVVERLYTALHRPSTCPHGFPIPRPTDADLPTIRDLYELEPGDIAEIAVSGSTEAQIVTFLETLGLLPGVEVTVVEKHPFDGPLVVEVDGNSRTLGQRVARQVFVTRLRPGPHSDDLPPTGEAPASGEGVAPPPGDAPPTDAAAGAAPDRDSAVDP